MAALTATLLAATAACSSSGAGSSDQTTGKRGGTLNLILQEGLEHLDPTEVYEVTEMNVSRLLDRTLTTYRDSPGAAGSELVPDLATDLGRPSDNNKTWEFTLKKNIKWEDGNPVTCDDLKYGVERRFAPQFSNGPTYPMDYLAGGGDYTGPYDGKSLDSIECVDQSTVRFHLVRPIGDFAYTLAMPVFAPMPKAQDKPGFFDRHPWSDGPYRVAKEFDGNSGPMVLERNPNWDRSTDNVRQAYPDKINLVIRENQAEEVTNEMIKDQADARTSIVLKDDVTPNFVQQVINDPGLSARTVTGDISGTTFIGINSRTVPNVDCRRALVLAFNKRRFRAMLGGSIFGDYATGAIPPDIASYKQFDPLQQNTHEEGQPDAAQALVDKAAKAGRPCPKQLTINYADIKKWQRAVGALAESLAAIDIKVIPKPFPAKHYYGMVSTQNKEGDLAIYTWLPDWPNGSSVIGPLFDGRLIPKDRSKPGNWDFGMINDPTVNQKIDAAMAEADLNKQYKMWGDLDEEIQTDLVPGIPVIHPKVLLMYGSQVHNAFLHVAFGEPDISAIWVG